MMRGGAALSEFQFTLPHGERPGKTYRVSSRLNVSIHAPAWGATSLLLERRRAFLFQFTLPHGERQ